MTQSTAPRGTLGTFQGVFTPSILTILGIILFLRLGFVVGNAGLAGALAIIGIATAISVTTSISLSAIATNIEVKGGGDYYLISRTLGHDFGGALGIVLFLAQSVSIGFYAIGFGEATAGIVGWEWSAAPQVIAAAAVAFLFLLAWAGADVASRFQSGILVLLVAALVSFYVGAVGGGPEEGFVLSGDAPVTLGFWAVFAIFFPAVTGFTQGVSMSGDLRDPGRSLPRGTFAAVGASTVVYVTVAILLARDVPMRVLVEDPTVMNRVAAVGGLIDAGVVAATLSSAMASFLGAPRILQSLASDHIFGFLDRFAKGDGPQNNPRRAVLVSLAIGMATIALGDLNAIAPVVSMFFLISYGLLNYATYYEARAASPSFRPRFRFFDKRVSLLGAIGCLGIMLAISPTAGAIAVAVLLSIRAYLRSQPTMNRWSDASRSHHFQRARESLRSLSRADAHERHWRPQVLTFSADPLRRARLFTFASWLEGGSGLAAAFSIVTGTGVGARRECAAEQAALDQQVADLGLDVHARAVTAPDGLASLPLIVQSFGIGELRANTVLFGWQETPGEDRRAGYVRALKQIARLGVNVVTVSTDDGRWDELAAIPAKKRRIDVWWTEDDASRLALLIAYLCTRTQGWHGATIRLVAHVDPSEVTAARAVLASMLERVRIDAQVTTIPATDRTTLVSAMGDASMVFLPIRLGRDQVLDVHDRDISDLVDGLPLAAGFAAAAPIDLEAGPESGRPGSIVAAEEAVDHAEQRVHEAEEQVRELQTALRRMILEGAGRGIEEVEEAEHAFEEAKHLRAKERVKLDDARTELDEIRQGGHPT